MNTLVKAAPVEHIGRATSDLSKRQCIYWRSFYDSQVDFKEPGTYVGAWTHLTNQGSAVKEGTLSYTGEANAWVIKLCCLS